jgi:hypothetical protein
MMTWSFPTPYGLFTRIRVKHDRLEAFKKAAARVAAAFHEHRTSRPWTAYSTVAGPGMYVYTLLPLRDLGDLDGMETLDTVMRDVYGEEGEADLRVFRDAIADIDTSVLAGVDFNQPPLEIGATPPQYVFYASITLYPGRLEEFMAALRHVAAAQPADSRWITYGTFAGRSSMHGFVVGDTIADLKKISLIERLTVEALGEESGRYMADIRGAIATMESSILRYVGHSNA